MKQQPAYVRISDIELDRVSELQALGCGVSKIARELGRAKSSISELITLNKDKRDGVFRVNLAARRRLERNQYQRKRVKLATNEQLLMELYIGMVYLKRSPEQIANRLKKEYPRDMSIHISSETIYEYIYVRAKALSVRTLSLHSGGHNVTVDNTAGGRYCKALCLISPLLMNAQRGSSPDVFRITGRVI